MLISTTLTEALDALAAEPTAMILSGGTDAMVEVNIAKMLTVVASVFLDVIRCLPVKNVLVPLGPAMAFAAHPRKLRNYDRQLTIQIGFLQAHVSALCNKFFTGRPS